MPAIDTQKGKPAKPPHYSGTIKRPTPDQADRNRVHRAKQLKESVHKGGDTKGDAETTKAENFKRTTQYVRDKFAARKAHYDQASPEEKKRLFGNPEEDAKDPRKLERFKAEEAQLQAAGIGGDALSNAYYTVLSKGALHPALYLMEKLGRAQHTVAGGVDAAVHHKNLGEEVGGNITGKKHTGFTDVLAGGDGKTNAGEKAAGFTLDMLTDPLNYVTFGAASPATIAARTASRGALRAAPHDLAKAASDAAAAGTGKATNKGLHASLRVPFTGREFSTSGKGTAFVSRHSGIHQAAQVAGEGHGPAGKVVDSLHHVAPDVKRAGVGQAEHDQTRDAARRLRASAHRTSQKAAHEREALRQAGVDETDLKYIERAPIHHPPLGMEKGTITSPAIGPPTAKGKLPTADYVEDVRPGLPRHEPHTDAQRFVRERQREMAAEEVAAGVLKPRQVKEDYFHHALPENLEAGDRVADKLSQFFRRGSTDAFTKPRKLNVSVEEARQLGVNFSEDVPRLHGQRVMQGGQRVNKATFVNDAIKGRPTYKPNTAFNTEHEAVFELTPKGNLKPVSDRKIQKVDDSGRTKPVKNWFILNKKNAGQIAEAVEGQTPNRNFFQRYVQGPWKSAVTQLNPSYHVGNEMGNRVMAWQADTTVKAWTDSHRALRLLAKRNKWEKSADRVKPGAKFEDTLSTDAARNRAGLKSVSDRELWKYVDEAEREGSLSSGVASHELQYLTNKQPGRIRRFGERRENQPRLATYISARQRGMTPSEAAKWTNKHHIDYGDLSPTERKLRDRGIPFYTFTARNTRLQAQKLLERPNKAANFELAREDVTRDSGEDPDFAKALKRYQQAGMPFVLRLGGVSYLLTPRTPIDQGISRAVGTPGDWMNTIGSAIGPIKIPFELGFNYSSFRREHIEDPDRDQGQVPMPTWLAQLVTKAPALTDALKVKQRDDGTWEWRAKADYGMNIVPLGKVAKDATLPKNAQNPYQQTPAQSVISAAGVKVSTFDKQQILSQKAREAYNKAQDALTEFDRLHKSQRTDDGFFNSKERQALVDAQSAAKKKVDALDKRPKTQPLDSRPKSLAEGYREKIKKLQTEDLSAEYKRKIARERAKLKIQSGQK